MRKLRTLSINIFLFVIFLFMDKVVQNRKDLVHMLVPQRMQLLKHLVVELFLHFVFVLKHLVALTVLESE